MLPRPPLARAIRALTLGVALSVVGGLVPARAPAADTVNVVVLREHGVGSAAHAQKYLDSLVAVAAKLNGWSAASGKYHTRRASAVAYIGSARPQFGILSLGAFLALRGKHPMKVIGRVDLSGPGGRQYHVISKTATKLAQCRGKQLASDHADDPRFIDRVVAKGKFTLADFTVVATRRPLQTVKKVIRDEADCALIDDAQYADLSNVEGGKQLRSLWRSSRLPPMVVVSFGAAPADRVKAFRSKLGRVCSGPGKQACKESGMRALMPATEVEYRTVIKAYGG